MSNKVKYLSLSEIRIDGGTQSRVTINETAVAEYADEMQSGKDLDLAVVFFDGTDNWLADGFHRFHGANKAKKKSLRCEIYSGTRRDAVLHSVGANANHGLRRSNEDKRKAVETLLEDEEWSAWSNNKIAESCAVSSPFVADVRGSLTINIYSENGENRREYITKHGTTAKMNTVNIGRQSEPEITPEPEIEAIKVDDEGDYFDDDEDLFDDAPVAPIVSEDQAVPRDLGDTSIEQKIESLALYRALTQHGHSGRIFFDQAEIWYENEKLFKAAHAKLSRLKYTTGPVTDGIQQLAWIPEPSQWEGCAACKGTLRVGERADPCPRCKGGFTVHQNQGVSADVIAANAGITAESE